MKTGSSARERDNISTVSARKLGVKDRVLCYRDRRGEDEIKNRHISSKILKTFHMIHTSVNFTISALREFPTFLYIFPTFSYIAFNLE